MSVMAVWLALASALPATSAVLEVPHSEYRARREALAKALPVGVTILFGRAETDNDDLRSGFYQESNFAYLSGWLEPGAVLLIEPRENAPSREIIFLPQRDATKERWTGHKTAPDDANARELTGFDTVMPMEKLEAEVKSSLDRLRIVYTVGDPSMASLKALAPLRPVENAAPAIARLRMHKSTREIEMLQHSADATIAAHRAAWRRATPGMFEYQVAALMTQVYFDQGCQRSAYAPIVGSGPNATILHYSRNARRIDRGELLLMDVAAECAGYAADVTRTVPVGAPFDKRQREIYDIVLGAQNAVIAAVKPGALIGKNSPGSLYRIAFDYINTHGQDLHGEPLGKYFIHGVSHHVGLDVHDAWDPETPLEEGMVITVEPGIYIPEENLGVRIEDMVLVTKDGARVMTSALPREPGDIEKAIGR
jgi:Xaa-Pro aminopeptidase